MNKITRAIISVSDKTGIVEFAKALKELGVEILSTGGTAKAFHQAGIDAIEIADYTLSPEILDGRLKTLHPKIHGGILGMRDNKDHQREMKENSIELIDLVVVNLYPFEETISKKDCSFEHAVENIDIGGPTMLRAAAKNHKDVAVVCDPKDYDDIINELKKNNCAISDKTKFHLCKKVFLHTARYDSAIITYLSKLTDEKAVMDMPEHIGFTFSKVQDLRYGENPHQKACFYRENTDVKGPSLITAKQLHGKELSYNNIMDADAVIEIVTEMSSYPFAAVVVKHSNPCGVAVSEKFMQDAFIMARDCDPVSAFGGIIGVNKILDEETAKSILETFFEVIVAPDFDDQAKQLLMAKKNMRLLKIDNLGKDSNLVGINLRKVVGGLLVQDRDTIIENIRDAKVVTKRKPSDEEWQALEFAWKVCKHVKSNAIVYADKNKTLGIGAGQMSRVDSSKIAVMKAMSALKGSVVASDAFFPFRDGVDEAAKAGARAVIQPGGSIRDDEVIKAADEHGLAMVFTGTRHFKH